MSAATFTLTGPASVIEAVPYLLGFTPTDSLVLVGLRKRSVTVTARLDLDGLTDREVTDVLRVLATEGESTAAVAITYAAHAEAGPLARAAASVGITIAEHLRVHAGRYWSLTCPVEGCCPADGTPVPVPAAVAAEFVARGHAPARSRADLGAQLDPTGDPDRLLPLLAREQERLAADLAGDVTGERARSRAAADSRLVCAAARCKDLNWTDEQIARLAVALTSYAGRDAAWLAIDAGRMDGRHLFAHLARQLPASHRAPALFLFAWKTWRDGNGALASIALDRVFDADPDYTAARLLRTALDRGIDPRRMPKLQLPT